mmetsp:Transcript_6056/g.16963  ORF Transcript_6056/g.16963 Transcript_6056/m.16963 type:complete len:213 (+) Transcript_6056:723-1361(+)
MPAAVNDHVAVNLKNVDHSIFQGPTAAMCLGYSAVGGHLAASVRLALSHRLTSAVGTREAAQEARGHAHVASEGDHVMPPHGADLCDGSLGDAGPRHAKLEQLTSAVYDVAPHPVQAAHATAEALDARRWADHVVLTADLRVAVTSAIPARAPAKPISLQVALRSTTSASSEDRPNSTPSMPCAQRLPARQAEPWTTQCQAAPQDEKPGRAP